MPQTFLDVLTRAAPEVAPERRETMARELDAIQARMSAVLANLKDPQVQFDIFACFRADVMAALKSPAHPLTPEMLASIRETTNIDEIMAQVNEIQRTGGFTFEDVRRELDKVIKP